MSTLFTHTNVRRPTSARRLFTLKRAQRSLVLVKRIVDDLVRSHRRAEELHESLEAAQSASLTELAARIREELLQSAGNVRRCMQELADVGAEVEDGRLGVVDFPARDGRKEIRLCWRWGESRVAHWHERDETAAQRKSVAAL